MSALLLLFRMKSVGSIRQWWREAKSPEGFIRAVFTLGFVSLIFIPLITGYFQLRDEEGPIPEKYVIKFEWAVNHVLSLFIAAMTYITFAIPKNSKSLNFQSSEIEFLFTAPFERRELLLYKLLGIASASVLIALGLNLFMGSLYFVFGGNFLFHFLRGLVTAFLVLLMFQQLHVLSGLVRKAFLVRLFSPSRKIMAIIAVALLVSGLFSIRHHLTSESFQVEQDPEKLLAVATEFVETDAIQWAAYPFRIFGNLILARTTGPILLWGSLCAGVNVLLFGLIMMTDKNFLEAELRANRAKMEMAKKQATLEAAIVTDSKSGSLPMLPFMGGAGPIAWRALQTFYRSKKVMIIGLGVYLAFMIGILLIDPKSGDPRQRFAMITAFLAILTLGATLSMPMGFQTDVQKMDIFKSLPISSLQIVLGQLLGPLIVLTMVQWLVAFVFCFVALEVWHLWLALVAYAPVVTLCLLGIINSLCLLYPKKPDDGVVRELENVGHILVFMFLSGIVGGLLLVALAMTGGAVYFATGSVPLVCVACWFVFLVVSLVSVFATTYLFARFDVSKHQR